MVISKLDEKCNLDAGAFASLTPLSFKLPLLTRRSMPDAVLKAKLLESILLVQATMPIFSSSA